MSKIYKNQTKVTLTATLGVDITGASSVLIKYKKPSGIPGQFNASIITALTGVISYDIVDSSDLDESGNWSFWGYVTFSDGKAAPGQPYTVEIYEEGK